MALKPLIQLTDLEAACVDSLIRLSQTKATSIGHGDKIRDQMITEVPALESQSQADLTAVTDGDHLHDYIPTPDGDSTHDFIMSDLAKVNSKKEEEGASSTTPHQDRQVTSAEPAIQQRPTSSNTEIDYIDLTLDAEDNGTHDFIVSNLPKVNSKKEEEVACSTTPHQDRQATSAEPAIQQRPTSSNTEIDYIDLTLDTEDDDSTTNINGDGADVEYKNNDEAVSLSRKRTADFQSMSSSTPGKRKREEGYWAGEFIRMHLQSEYTRQYGLEVGDQSTRS
ncbi:hypothetical protein ACJ41O_013824 [Fusarium nematophilum]